MKLDLSSLKRAIGSMEKALQITEGKFIQQDISTDEIELLKAGVIQNFEITYELCWKFMKRWIESNVSAEVVDGVPRKELFRLAAENRLITDVDEWMEYHRARNISSHIYDHKISDEVYQISQKFSGAASQLLKNLEMRND